MQPRQRPERARHDRPSVLLVDPDDAARARTFDVLTAAGCEVVAAVANHAQAIVRAKEHQPDVIVTGLEGGRFLTPEAYVAALHRKAPLAGVVIYAKVIPDSAEAKGWGVAATLVKPIERERLGDAVRVAHRSVCHACH
jgi:AmiR/NasT family two-component response regulator